MLSNWPTGLNEDEREVSEQPIGPPAQSTQATEDVPSEQQAHNHATDNFLSALNGDIEQGRINFQNFGICSPGAPGFQLSDLLQNAQQTQKGLKGVHAIKGRYIFLWFPGKPLVYLDVCSVDTVRWVVVNVFIFR